MKVRTFTKATAVALGAAVLALGVTASPAAADPTPAAPPFGLLAGVGSDTTFNVMNGLSAVLTTGGNRTLDSWDPGIAPASPMITTKAPATNANCDGDAPANDGFVRPNGSSQGRDALIASEFGGLWRNETITGCVDFARSSAGPRSAGTRLTYVPFGVDAVVLAKHGDSFLPDAISFAQSQRIYQCLSTDIAGTPVIPLLLQSGSGTRQFWNEAVGITEADIASGLFDCLEDLDNTVQEHDGNPLALDPSQRFVVPFSVGQFISQSNRAQIQTQTGVQVTDRRGPASLMAMSTAATGTQAPIVGGQLNINLPSNVKRDVYNVVPTQDLTAGSLASNTFAGPTSAICARRDVIQLFGFGFRGPTDAQNPAANQRRCGATDFTGNT